MDQFGIPYVLPIGENYRRSLCEEVWFVYYSVYFDAENWPGKVA